MGENYTGFQACRKNRKSTLLIKSIREKPENMSIAPEFDLPEYPSYLFHYLKPELHLLEIAFERILITCIHPGNGSGTVVLSPNPPL